MRTLIRIIGVAVVAAGLLVLTPAAVLANQRFRLFHVTWGIFDMQINGVPLSNTSVALFSTVGALALFVLGFVLLHPHPRSAA